MCRNSSWEFIMYLVGRYWNIILFNSFWTTSAVVEIWETQISKQHWIYSFWCPRIRYLIGILCLIAAVLWNLLQHLFTVTIFLTCLWNWTVVFYLILRILFCRHIEFFCGFFLFFVKIECFEFIFDAFNIKSVSCEWDIFLW